MNKKSQGLSINMIIIAAIALVVLIVLWAIFTGRMGQFNIGVKDVESNIRCTDDAIGGEVITLGENIKDCPQGKAKIPGKFRDVAQNQLCCNR